MGGQFIDPNLVEAFTPVVPKVTPPPSPQRPVSRLDSQHTGTKFYWTVDGRPWELSREQLKDWHAITTRGALSEGLNGLLPVFWTSIAEFEAEVQREARSYRDHLLWHEGAPNPIDISNRRSDRIQADMQADFAELATSVDNGLFVAGLAKAPLKLGLNILKKSAEKRVASSLAKKSVVETALGHHTVPPGNSLRPKQAPLGRLGSSPISPNLHNLIDEVPGTVLRTHAVPEVPDQLLRSFDVKDIGPSHYIPPGSASGSQPKPLLLTHQQATTTLADARGLTGRARWRGGEEHIRELYGSSGTKHFPVPTGSGITGKGGRFPDAPVFNPNGTLGIEVKMYGQPVPLSSNIRQRVLKDVWLRSNVPGYDPRWIFLDAPPSEQLHSFLREHHIVTCIHGN